MPILNKNKDEDNDQFVSRCMSNEIMKKEYPDTKQRVAICLGQTKRKTNSNILDFVMDILGFSISYDECESCENEELLNFTNIIFPNDNEYIDTDEETELYDVAHIVASEYQGRKVTLNKPFRTPDGPKKFAVYVKNGSGKVVIVRFGDPNMKIKKNIPERRKSFRARMRCDNPGPKYMARYWSCKMW